MNFRNISTVVVVLIAAGMCLFMPVSTPFLLKCTVFAFFGILLMSFFLLHFYQVHKILQTTEKIASGELTSRVSSVAWGPVNPLVASINDMATRIETLVNAQRELTRAVSHELRTPVARMRFGLEMMESAENASERALRRDRIERDIDELDQLIDELLTYARLEDGAPALNFRDVELERIVQAVVDKASKSGSDKTIEFKRKHDGELAYVEPRFIQRAAQNLIMNAVKYSRERINVRIISEKDGFYLIVDDDGPGIPVERRIDIFEPFARVDKSRTRETGGYGLGLAIVSRIAKWHKGTVSISDSELGGAQFVLWWPK